MATGSGQKPPEPSSTFDRSVEEVDLPESPSALPSAALAAHAVPALADRREADREIWRLAWPAMLSLAMANVVSLVDIAMIGRLGTALAAGGYATQFLFLSQSVLFSIGIACVAVMARAIGAGDPDRARTALGASLGLGVFAAVVVTAAVTVAPLPLLALLDAPTEVAELSVPYLRLVVGSSVLFSGAIVLESAFRAAEGAGGSWLAVIALSPRPVMPYWFRHSLPASGAAQG